MTTPRCACHGEPMQRNGQREGRQMWCCRIKHETRRRHQYATDPVFREKEQRRKYWDLPGLEYQRELLRSRRWKALRRRESRHATATKTKPTFAGTDSGAD